VSSTIEVAVVTGSFTFGAVVLTYLGSGFVSDNSPGVKNTLLTVLSGKPTVCDMMARQRTPRIPVVLGG
jgi:hypothetical protein